VLFIKLSHERPNLGNPNYFLTIYSQGAIGDVLIL